MAPSDLEAPYHQAMMTPCTAAYLTERFEMAVKIAKYVAGGVSQSLTGVLSEPARIPSAATMLAIATSIMNTPDSGPKRTMVVFHSRLGPPREESPVSVFEMAVGERAAKPTDGGCARNTE